MNIQHNGKVYFTESELRCKQTGIIKLAPGFAEALLSLRLVYARPMPVNSCCRSKDHNAKVGGNPRSLHVYDSPFWPTGGTCAIDIGITDATQRAELVKIALESGWWVGLHSAFIHLDRRIDYRIADKPGIFLY